MNSGELPLKIRRNVSFAPEGAGIESAAPPARQAAAIRNKKRSREVFMVLCDRKAVKVMRDRKTVNASIRCAATRRALRLKVSLILAESNLIRTSLI